MTTARDIMTANATCVSASETVLDAAKKMAAESVGAVPICGEDGKLKGMLTDRDIVVKVLAEGKDPRALHASELAQGEAVTIGADDDAEEIMRTMANHKVRRLPVIDGHKLVGIVAQADVAKALPNPDSGELVEALSYD
ncbi:MULTISPECIES: CBS domain-containing protein [Amycolatopsis]|uniref:Signal transduction protein n=3 Tax=Amycolatopsis japonica group TaxID=2893673 RepID=R4SQC3_9PSEU|nr:MULTISPECIES: CBS domain-containing protein [Amycolatopsis]AGM05689.1 signal transduction protein [Amycolatopsis keratiniphila]AIG77617.1 signal-transduction protein [Amycolatopsis japonica]OKJ96397.1 histidine kinase [Amycolatopsis sp. CB00013]OLZ58278.1 histidine kinase [Amycolatopsis keratiniphila subsp. nogabecina]ONF69927.1 histidine kinase [Amycolatopsis keratiniphila subsp. keratiniphila]